MRHNTLIFALVMVALTLAVAGCDELPVDESPTATDRDPAPPTNGQTETDTETESESESVSVPEPEPGPSTLPTMTSDGGCEGMSGELLPPPDLGDNEADDEPSPPVSWSWDAASRELTIIHSGALFNCCPDEIATTTTLEHPEGGPTVLHVHEYEVVEVPCDCLCTYTVTSVVTDLVAGEYELLVTQGSGELLREIINLAP